MSAAKPPAAETSVQRKISAEKLEALTKRIYEDSMRHRKETVETLSKKFYKVQPPQCIAKEEMEASAVRQVNDEMERRAKRAEDLHKKYYKESDPLTLSTQEMEDSVKRIYSDAMRHKQDQLEKLEKKFAFKREKKRPITASQLKDSANRLCKPQKRTFTEDEINRIMGLTK